MCQGCCTQEAQGPQGTGTALWEGVRESYYQCCAWNLCATRLQLWLQFLMSCQCSLSQIQNNMFIGEILSIQWMAFRFFSLVSSVQFDAQVWADAARRLPLPPDHHCKIQGWNFQEKDTGRVWSYKTDSLLHWSMCYKVSTRTYEPVSILLETMWIVCWGPHYRTLAGWKNSGQPWNASRLLDMTEIYKLFCCFLQLIPKFSSIFRNFMIEVNPNELQVCKEARNYFTCQRPLHVAWLIYSILQYSQWIEGIQNWGQNPFRLCEALDIYTTAMHCGTLNVSQNIDRMTHGDRERVQCITPKAMLWHPPSKRPLSGRINTHAQIEQIFHLIPG